MEDLVDVFYYDYILSRIIELYEQAASISVLIPYLKIATVLSKKFRDDKISLDSQIYMKEAYVKIVQITKQHFMKPGMDVSTVLKAFECFQVIMEEFPDVEQEKGFENIKAVAVFIYGLTKKGLTLNECAEYQKYDEYINKITASLKEESRNMIKTLNEECSYEKVMEFLNEIKFQNPVLKRFAEFVKDDVDREQSIIGEKKITTGNSPGEKVKW